MEFIARLVQHIPDEHFRQTRYAGLFATRVRSKLLPKARLLLGQAPKPAPQPLLWRDLFQKTFHPDPLLCPHCRVSLEFGTVLHLSSRGVRSCISTRHLQLRKQAYGTPTPQPSESRCHAQVLPTGASP